MRTAIVVVLVVLVCVGGLLAWRAQQHDLGGRLYIAVPMGVFVPFGKVMDAFQSVHPDVEFMTMVDTPETMAEAVIENENKPDIFMSPGGHEVTYLVEREMVDPESLVAFGSYEVAILVPTGNPGGIQEPADLLSPEVKVISFSPPDLTAASHAARQALQNMGLWDDIESKVQVTGCCNESFQWVVDGRAQANVQFVGCPIDPTTEEMFDTAEIACIFPRDTYYVPRNVAGIVTTTEERGLAERFLAFLGSPEMIELMANTNMRNDQNLPLRAGSWGPEYEAGPQMVRVLHR
jgi:molybdate transport system substrate-binding protein